MAAAREFPKLTDITTIADRKAAIAAMEAIRFVLKNLAAEEKISGDVDYQRAIIGALLMEMSGKTGFEGKGLTVGPDMQEQAKFLAVLTKESEVHDDTLDLGDTSDKHQKKRRDKKHIAQQLQDWMRAYFVTSNIFPDNFALEINVEKNPNPSRLSFTVTDHHRNIVAQSTLHPLCGLASIVNELDADRRAKQGALLEELTAMQPKKPKPTKFSEIVERYAQFCNPNQPDGTSHVLRWDEASKGSMLDVVGANGDVVAKIDMAAFRDKYSRNPSTTLSSFQKSPELFFLPPALKPAVLASQLNRFIQENNLVGHTTGSVAVEVLSDNRISISGFKDKEPLVVNLGDLPQTANSSRAPLCYEFLLRITDYMQVHESRVTFPPSLCELQDMADDCCDVSRPKKLRLIFLQDLDNYDVVHLCAANDENIATAPLVCRATLNRDQVATLAAPLEAKCGLERVEELKARFYTALCPNITRHALEGAALKVLRSTAVAGKEKKGGVLGSTRSAPPSLRKDRGPDTPAVTRRPALKPDTFMSQSAAAAAPATSAATPADTPAPAAVGASPATSGAAAAAEGTTTTPLRVKIPKPPQAATPADTPAPAAAPAAVGASPATSATTPAAAAGTTTTQPSPKPTPKPRRRPDAAAPGADVPNTNLGNAASRGHIKRDRTPTPPMS